MSGAMNKVKPLKPLDASALLRGALPMGAALAVGGRGSFFRSARIRNPLISPDSRKFFATFCNKWKLLEALPEGN